MGFTLTRIIHSSTGGVSSATNGCSRLEMPIAVTPGRVPPSIPHQSYHISSVYNYQYCSRHGQASIPQRDLLHPPQSSKLKAVADSLRGSGRSRKTCTEFGSLEGCGFLHHSGNPLNKERSTEALLSLGCRGSRRFCPTAVICVRLSV